MESILYWFVIMMVILNLVLLNELKKIMRLFELTNDAWMKLMMDMIAPGIKCEEFDEKLTKTTKKSSCE